MFLREAEGPGVGANSTGVSRKDFLRGLGAAGVGTLVVGGVGGFFGGSSSSSGGSSEYTVLGLFLLVVVIFVPDGLTGLIARYRGRIAAWVAEGESDAGDGGAPASDDVRKGNEISVQHEGSPDPHVA